LRSSFSGLGSSSSEGVHSHRLAPHWRYSASPFLPLPGAHAVGHPFVEIGGAHTNLYVCKPKSLPDFVAHAGKGDGDAPPLQLFDGAQQGVAAGGIDKVYASAVRKTL